MLANYAKKILEDREQGQKIYEKLYEMKVVEDVKSKIKGDRKGRFCRRVPKTGQGDLRNSGKLVSDQSFEGLIFAITPSKSV